MTNPLNAQRDALRRIAARLTARQRNCRVPAVILMTDDGRDADWAAAVRALPRGAAVIVRARDAGRREALARALMPVARKAGVWVLIAADPALAVKLRADGVHCPEKQSATLAGLRRSNPKLILTMSAHGVPGLVAAHRSGAHASILSAMFATASHPGGDALGPRRWGMLRRQTRLPVAALGGIGPQSAKAALALGADAVAVIGAWTAI